jgi:hypothetical protein
MGQATTQSPAVTSLQGSLVQANPVSGVFGTGRMQIYSANDTFTVPAGITSARARVWGAGGAGNSSNGGGGGGFAMKVVTGLTPGGTVAITVGTTAGASSSFGAYCSATGGGNPAGGAGTGFYVYFNGGTG